MIKFLLAFIASMQVIILIAILRLTDVMQAVHS